MCVPHRQIKGMHVAYVGTHICTVPRGCAGGELVCAPPCTPPPCGPSEGLWVPGWVARHHQQSWAQPDAAACPMAGQEAVEYLSLSGGPDGAGLGASSLQQPWHGQGGPSMVLRGSKMDRSPPPSAAASKRYQRRCEGLHQPAHSEPSGDTQSPTSISGAGCTGKGRAVLNLSSSSSQRAWSSQSGVDGVRPFPPRCSPPSQRPALPMPQPQGWHRDTAWLGTVAGGGGRWVLSPGRMFQLPPFPVPSPKPCRGEGHSFPHGARALPHVSRRYSSPLIVSNNACVPGQRCLCQCISRCRVLKYPRLSLIHI